MTDDRHHFDTIEYKGKTWKVMFDEPPKVEERHLDPTEIREARERLDMTQAELAFEFGITPRTVRRWESGEIEPPRLVAFAYQALLAQNAKEMDAGIKLHFDNLVAEAEVEKLVSEGKLAPKGEPFSD